MSRDYDLAIIGGGSAGLTGAGLAVQLGARVALVEKHRVGGDCTWTGCVPSKTLLKAAKVAQEMRTADVHGLGAVEPTVDFKRVMDHVRAVVSDVYHNESPESLSSDGIDVFIGAARFRDSHTLSVGDTTIRARKLLLVKGAHPLVPSVPGLDDVSYLTYENVWDLDALPRRLLVVGGGPIGCEMAQAFRRLGSQVTLVEAAERLLLQDTPQASRVIAERFADEGITLRFNAPLQRARQDGEGIHVVAGDEEMVADQVFVAVGRRPNVKGLDLEIAGVSYSDRGIMVDSRLRTSKRHIYAAGDCTGGFQFTHYAGWQGFMAVRNALLPGATKAVVDRVPWAMFTAPEVAHVGLTEERARESLGNGVLVCDWPMDQVDRARTESDTNGFIKVVHKEDGRILGVTIVAARAGEMIQGWTVGLDRGLKIGDLARSIHVYPTYSTASMQAAAHIRVAQLLSGASGRVVRGLARLSR